MAPDFIIELKSETDSLADLQDKMLKWIANGVRLGWLICMDTQLTYIYQPDHKILTVRFDEMLSGEPVLEHFAVRLQDILEY